VLVHII